MADTIVKIPMAATPNSGKKIIRLSEWARIPKEFSIDQDAVFIDDSPGSMNYRILLENRTRLDYFFLSNQPTPGQLSRTIDFDLRGEGSRLIARGLIVGQGQQRRRFTIRQLHRQPFTEAEVILRTVVRDRASLTIDDTILIEKAANFSRSHYKNHNLILSEAATVQTTPTLEIFAKDVECSHGATAGGIDERQRFYLRTRGIPNGPAEELLVAGFVHEITDQLHRQLGQSSTEGGRDLNQIDGQT